MSRAALEGCRYLHLIGVLDDRLEVVGRREARARLMAAALQNPGRASRRANAYELALKELVSAPDIERIVLDQIASVCTRRTRTRPANRRPCGFLPRNLDRTE